MINNQEQPSAAGANDSDRQDRDSRWRLAAVQMNRNEINRRLQELELLKTAKQTTVVKIKIKELEEYIAKLKKLLPENKE